VLFLLSRPSTPPNEIQFYDLPAGAIDGTWSSKAVSDGRNLNNNIERLTLRSSYIVRAKIIDERYEVVTDSWHVPSVPILYSFYRLKVLDVFKGEIGVGSYIEISQIKGTRNPVNRYRCSMDGYVRIEFIRVPLNVGDDLILFLRYVNKSIVSTDETSRDTMTVGRFHPIQGVYHYTPLKERTHDNWVFESVNEHNNLVLTEADLLWILERD